MTSLDTRLERLLPQLQKTASGSQRLKAMSDFITSEAGPETLAATIEETALKIADNASCDADKNPLGFLGIRLADAKSHSGDMLSVRLHLYDPSVAQHTFEDHPHSHAWDCASSTIFGKITHTFWTKFSKPLENCFHCFHLEKLSKTGTLKNVLLAFDKLVNLKKLRVQEVSKGETITFPKDKLHSVKTDPETATLLLGFATPKTRPEFIFPESKLPLAQGKEQTSLSFERLSLSDTISLLLDFLIYKLKKSPPSCSISNTSLERSAR